METIEVVALVAAVLFFLAVLRRSTSPAVQLVRDPAIAHRLLNEMAGGLTNRPTAGLFTALATWTGGRERAENISTVAYGSHWRSLRSNLTAGFLSPSRLAALAPLQRDAVQVLVTGLALAAGSDSAVVIREHLDRAIFALSARLCFGNGVEERCVRALQCVMEDVAKAMDDAVSFDGSTLGKITHWRRVRRLQGMSVPLGELVRPLIVAARTRKTTADRRSPHASYVDSLVDLRIPIRDDVDGLTRALADDEILALVMEFLGPSTGVIVACIEWTIAHLVIQPELLEKLHREMDAGGEEHSSSYLHAVVLESLRMHPPSPFVTRAVHDLASGRLTKRLIFVVRDIGRHGSAWTEPDQFSPERFLPAGEAENVGQMPGRDEIRMMPFGAGRRFCPASSLGILQAKFFVAALVRRFEMAPPRPSCGVDLTEVGAFKNVMKKPLRVRVTQRTLH